MLNSSMGKTIATDFEFIETEPDRIRHIELLARFKTALRAKKHVQLIELVGKAIKKVVH